MSELARYVQRTAELLAETRRAGYLYANQYEFVLGEGEQMTRVATYDSGRWGEPGGMGRCYFNAYQLADDNPELTYVEGLAAGVLPTWHAWCVDEDGHVVDPTWVEQAFLAVDYYGVRFPTWYVRRTVLALGRYGIIDDWQHDWPLCRRPLAVTLEEAFVA